MKKAIVQFIKKYNLARDLAAGGLLPLVSGLAGFRLYRWLFYRAVYKSAAPDSQAVTAWLNRRTNPFLLALVDELTSRPDILGSDYVFIRSQPNFSAAGLVCYKSAGNFSDRRFYHRIFEELADHDFPQLASHRSVFNKRLDSLTDLRFYGSDVETLIDETAGCEDACPYQVDWARTGAGELWLDFPETAMLNRRLTPPAQAALLRLVLYLLLERQLFVSSFRGVICDESNRVNLVDFDYIYPFDRQLLDFLKAYLNGSATPQTHLQYKLARLLRLMKIYCPDYDVLGEMNAALSGFDFPSAADSSSQTDMLALYARVGRPAHSASKPAPSNPATLAYLLDKTRFKKDPAFKKSSAWYYVPLLIAIYLLLKYF